jgi:hypothetical protein
LVSGAEQPRSEHAVGAPIGAQDADQSSEHWRSGYQDSSTALSMYKALIAKYKIGIRQGARSIQMRTGFIKQNMNLKGTVQ